MAVIINYFREVSVGFHKLVIQEVYLNLPPF